MALRYYRNGPARQLAFPIANASDTSMTVDSASGFPTQFPYTLIIEPDTGLEEVVDVTAAVGNVLTITRGVDSSTASAHGAGSVVYHGVSARDHREANAHVNATTNVHGRTGSLVDTDTVQTVTGRKIFTDLETVDGGDVVTVGATQTVTGAKTFDSLATTAGGAVVAVNGSQTIPGNKTFSGGNTHSGNNTFSGSNQHNGTETFNGVVAMDGANVTEAWIPYTPVWRDGPSGTSLLIGNGTLEGFYKRIGKTVFFRILLVRGSTSNLGTALGYTFTLPVAPQDYRQSGTVIMLDVSATTYYGIHWHGIGSTEIVLLNVGGTRVSGTSPISWATGDSIFISGTYEAA